MGAFVGGFVVAFVILAAFSPNTSSILNTLTKNVERIAIALESQNRNCR